LTKNSLTEDYSKNILVIYADSKKDKLGYGNYLRIISILPNLNFKKFIWISDLQSIKLIKYCNVISSYHTYHSSVGKNFLKYSKNILNLVDDGTSNKTEKFLKSYLDKNLNIKKSGNDLCQLILKKIYKTKKYKLYHNKKKFIKKFKYDLFINYIVPNEWKIKRYPIRLFKNLESKLNLEKNIKIGWQNRSDKIEKYVEKIKNSKIILTIIGLGTHIGMLFNKKIIVLAGPTSFEDLKKYNNKIVFYPKYKCKCQTILLNQNKSCELHRFQSCMHDIDHNKLLNKIKIIL